MVVDVYVYLPNIKSVLVVVCLTTKCGRCGIHSLIYCGLSGHDLHGPTRATNKRFDQIHEYKRLQYDSY